MFTRLFPLWAVFSAALGALYPDLLAQLKPGIVPALILIMFGMGLNLDYADFTRVLKLPGAIALGVAVQYLVMPLTAFGLSILFAFEPMLLLGMILVGASAGGTASNVICFLAKGNVALSISMTLVSTLLAVIALPLLTELYAGHAVDIPASRMLISTLQILLIPVVTGVFLNHYFSRQISKARALAPVISVLGICFAIAVIVALNVERFASLACSIVVAVALHNAIGLMAGYWAGYYCGYDKATCRTLAIEVGMQNSGLSVALALKYFPAVAALPGAIFSLWHNLSGSILAAIWGREENCPPE